MALYNRFIFFLHDPFSLGEFKNDQLQDHQHTRGDMNITGWIEQVESKGAWGGAFTGYREAGGAAWGTGDNPRNRISFDASWTWTGSTSDPSTGSHGSVTRGKRLGVNFIIKY